MLSPGPSFPAEATTVVPRSAALLAATELGVSGPPTPPRLRLITCATGFGCSVKVRGETESSIERMVAAVTQVPAALQTLYAITLACGAMPCRRRSSAFPGMPSAPGAKPRYPAASAEACVPCPKSSTKLGLSGR